MTISTAIQATAAATLFCLAVPSAAQADDTNFDRDDRHIAEMDEIDANAENIRKLDIMLMVTSLRCRTGASDFQADYDAFATAHLPTLNQASKVLKAELAYLYGEAGAVHEMDRTDVSMANEYGEGHPWLSCHELGSIARQLASDSDPVRLSYAADELLAAYPVYAPVRMPRQTARR